MEQVAVIPSDQLSLFELGVNMNTLREGRQALLSSWKQASATRKGYAIDWKIFSEWCTASGRSSLPTTEDTLCNFLFAQLESGLKVSTVERRLAAITSAHVCKELPNPVTKECRTLLSCARRQRKEQKKGKLSLEVKDLHRISRKLGDSNAGIRNRAILVFGFASALRRSELARLKLDDVKFSEKGLAVTVSWDKGDQEGKGRTFGIFRGSKKATDPVRTLRAWLDVRGKSPGPLFTRVDCADVVSLLPIGGDRVNTIVQNAIESIGINPKPYGAHSLRAGLVTAAAENGASDREIMRASGHRSARVMAQYIRPVQVFSQRNPLAGVL